MRFAPLPQAARAFLAHEVRNQLFPQSVLLDQLKDVLPPEWLGDLNQVGRPCWEG